MSIGRRGQVHLEDDIDMIHFELLVTDDGAISRAGQPKKEELA